MHLSSFPACLLATLLLIVMPADTAGGGDTSLPSPLVAYVSASSAECFVETADTVLSSVLKDIPMDSGSGFFFRPGTLAALGVSNLFPALDMGVSMAIVADRDGDPEIAFVLDGMDREDLARFGERDGVALRMEGGTASVGIEMLGVDLDMVFVEVGDGRWVVGDGEEAAARFATVFREWRPEPPDDGAVRILVDLHRLSVQRYDGWRLGQITFFLEDNDFLEPFPRDSRRGLVNLPLQMMRFSNQYFNLLMEARLAEIVLSIDDGMLEIQWSVAFEKDGVVAKFANLYAEAGNPVFLAEDAVYDDALYFSAFTTAHGTLFPRAGFMHAAAIGLFSALVPDKAYLAEALEGEGYGNPAEEEVTALYLRDNRFLRVGYTRAEDGKRYMSMLLRRADMANAFLERLMEVHGVEGRARVSVEAGKRDKVKYWRLAPVVENFGAVDAQTASLVNTAGYFALYLASNYHTVMSVSGVGVTSDTLMREIARYDAETDRRFKDDKKVSALYYRLDKHELGHVILRPVALLQNIVLFLEQSGMLRRDIPPGVFSRYFEDLPAGDSLAAFAFGAGEDSLTGEMHLPMDGLNSTAHILRAVSEDSFGDFLPEKYEQWIDEERERQEAGREDAEKKRREDLYWKTEEEPGDTE